MHPTSPKPRLRPGAYLADVLQTFPELTSTANIEVISPMNLDSSHMGPAHWVTIATLLHEHRAEYDGFVIIHGTDTMNFTGSALSLMLAGFAKPVVLTGSQLPMSFPRSDARQNFVDAVAVACAGRLQEVAICFGGCLLRANRAVKYSSSAYSAYKSPTYPHLATLGVDIEWDTRALYTCTQVYRPRLKLEASVARIPIVPGVDPNVAYGDMVGRGLRGVVIESFGVGNVPDCAGSAWGEWLAAQRKKGLRIYLASQCVTGPLNPELYCSGVDLAEEGACGRRMTSDTAVIKMMLCLAYPDLRISYPLAGEL